MINNIVSRRHIRTHDIHIWSKSKTWGATHHILFYFICSDNKLMIINSQYISAKSVPSVLGHTITLSCPVASSTSDTKRSIKQWFRGTNTGATMARLVTIGDLVEYNHTIIEKMWFNSMAGDLIIANLTLEDMGFYTCHFTGSKEQTIQLYVRGVFDCFFENVAWWEVNAVSNRKISQYSH